MSREKKKKRAKEEESLYTILKKKKNNNQNSFSITLVEGNSVGAKTFSKWEKNNSLCLIAHTTYHTFYP